MSSDQHLVGNLLAIAGNLPTAAETLPKSCRDLCTTFAFGDHLPRHPDFHGHQHRQSMITHQSADDADMLERLTVVKDAQYGLPELAKFDIDFGIGFGIEQVLVAMDNKKMGHAAAAKAWGRGTTNRLGGSELFIGNKARRLASCLGRYGRI